MPDLINVGMAGGLALGVLWIAKETNMRKASKVTISPSYTGPQAAPVFGKALPMPTRSPGLGWGFYAALLGCAVGAFVVVRLIMLLGL